jgi:hypothetical protein
LKLHSESGSSVAGVLPVADSAIHSGFVEAGGHYQAGWAAYTDSSSGSRAADSQVFVLNGSQLAPAHGHRLYTYIALLVLLKA